MVFLSLFLFLCFSCCALYWIQINYVCCALIQFCFLFQDTVDFNIPFRDDGQCRFFSLYCLSLKTGSSIVFFSKYKISLYIYIYKCFSGKTSSVCMELSWEWNSILEVTKLWHFPPPRQSNILIKVSNLKLLYLSAQYSICVSEIFICTKQMKQNIYF